MFLWSRRRAGLSSYSNNRRLRRYTPRVEALERRELLALVSYWSGNNTAIDPVSGNNGTLYNGATYAAGQVGQAIKFDGVDDRMLVADSPSLALTHSLSIEGWIKVNAIPTHDHGEILFRGDSRGGLDPYSLAIETNGILNFQISSADNQGTNVGLVSPIGQFIHVAATLDDATGAMCLYQNGVLVSQIVTTIRPFGALDPNQQPAVGIGNANSTYNSPFNGLIDELKLYDNALTADEVLSHFNATKGALQPQISISDASVTEGVTETTYLGNFAAALTPHKMIYGPDGNIYVTTLANNSVQRFDGITGAPLPAPGKANADFVSPGDGGLDAARELAFGPDGNFYVVSENSDAVLRYDAVTGDSLGALVSSGSGGLDTPRGLLFHSDGYLYVTSLGGTTAAPGLDSVLRFDAATGAPAGLSGQTEDAVFIPSRSGGLDNPSHIVFHNGSFYVSANVTNGILRYGIDGTFQGTFVSAGSGGLAGPSNFEFKDGYLYVVSWTNNKVLRYDGLTGAFINEVVSANGAITTTGMVFEPNGNFLLTSLNTNEIRRYGGTSDAIFTVSLAAPFPTSVSVNFSTGNATAQAGSDYVAASGTLTFAAGETRKTIRVSTLDDAAFEVNESFTVNLSNAIGGIIADAQGVATIIDNDTPPTKFYVADDGSMNNTFEYAANGVAIENYAISSGNSAPRGAASTAAGDKVWVVDANKNVYVYNTSGGLLGSWSAGSLASNADVQGISTNGTDVWIVDAKQDKVFRYSGAATRLTGSQNAASSFNLNGSNTGAKDLVTDGTSIWVVDDGSTDRIFKYSLSGSSLGSWTISGGGGSPTGITIDPSAVSSIWIVDSGSDRIYEFTNAASRTSGTQSPAISFALTAGNTNPQGIADPPGSSAAANSRAGDTNDLALLLFLSEDAVPKRLRL